MLQTRLGMLGKAVIPFPDAPSRSRLFVPASLDAGWDFCAMLSWSREEASRRKEKTIATQIDSSAAAGLITTPSPPDSFIRDQGFRTREPLRPPPR